MDHLCRATAISVIRELFSGPEKESWKGHPTAIPVSPRNPGA
jgi:hypothetical protein